MSEIRQYILLAVSFSGVLVTVELFYANAGAKTAISMTYTCIISPGKIIVSLGVGACLKFEKPRVVLLPFVAKRAEYFVGHMAIYGIV